MDRLIKLQYSEPAAAFSTVDVQQLLVSETAGNGNAVFATFIPTDISQPLCCHLSLVSSMQCDLGLCLKICTCW